VNFAPELRGRRALITGATGFIGGRLAERLVAEGVAVRALVRGYGSAVRLARLPVEIAKGDATDRVALAAAVRDCDMVFHCAYGTSGSQRHRAWVNIEGTRRLIEAAAGAQRIVHLSTLMVYGRTGDGDLDESAPRRRFGNPYSDSKLVAERIALDAARAGRAAVTVLQPTAVYGPWGGVWTAGVLHALRQGRQILVDGGEGLANAIYVDDLVDAMVRAATRDEAVGEAFLISDGVAVPWRVLYGHFAAMLGGGRTVVMTAAEALAHWRASRRQVPRLLPELLAATLENRVTRERLQTTREGLWARELASSLLPESAQQRIKQRLGGLGAATPAKAEQELPILPLTPEMVDFFRPKTRVLIGKAERLLGWRPAYDLDAGMEATAAWARWANLL
jgi:nucleoside-diphosphate-sugar epimerase